MESATRRAFRGPYGLFFELLEQIEPLFDRFTIPLIKHLSGSGTEQRLLDAHSPGFSPHRVFAEGGRIRPTHAVGKRRLPTVLIPQPGRFHEQKLVVSGDGAALWLRERLQRELSTG